MDEKYEVFQMVVSIFKKEKIFKEFLESENYS